MKKFILLLFLTCLTGSQTFYCMHNPQEIRDYIVRKDPGFEEKNQNRPLAPVYPNQTQSEHKFGDVKFEYQSMLQGKKLVWWIERWDIIKPLYETTLKKLNVRKLTSDKIILYRPEGYENALLLKKYFSFMPRFILVEQPNGFFKRSIIPSKEMQKKYESEGCFYNEALVGKLLGYTHEDIKFYYERNNKIINFDKDTKEAQNWIQNNNNNELVKYLDKPGFKLINHLNYQNFISRTSCLKLDEFLKKNK